MRFLLSEIWSILYMVDSYVCIATSCMQMIEESFANMPLTLTSEARVLKSKECGFQGHSLDGGVWGEAPQHNE